MTKEKQNRQFLSQGQGDRFDRWVEFFAIVIMSIATVLTAWSAYQASLWGGEESKAYFTASNALTDASRLDNQAAIRLGTHANLFSDYIAAIAQGDQVLSDFLYNRFPLELKNAMDVWLDLAPFQSADAPLTPFDLPEYQLPEVAEARAYRDKADVHLQLAQEADGYSDDYVLITVIFATVLFFGGISGKFQWRVIDAMGLMLGIMVLAVGIILLLTMPIQYAT
ncbi:hypothetical protein MASR2M15_07490 [Anaerolineales bacterium]